MARVVRSCHQRLQGGLNQPLGTGVERAGGLVQDQDARVLQDDAGDGDALLLAAGELVAALADDGVVALGQLHDAVVDGGGACGGVDLLLRSRPSGRRRCSRV